jgi:hypothetical protein
MLEGQDTAYSHESGYAPNMVSLKHTNLQALLPDRKKNCLSICCQDKKNCPEQQGKSLQSHNRNADEVQTPGLAGFRNLRKVLLLAEC